jgi:three-Cys-motif partner protein
LLAGPGRCLYEQNEFDGSPLIALKTLPKFDRLHFGDEDKENIEALKARVPADNLSRVKFYQGDCNEFVNEILKSLSYNDLGLAFVDPQGFEVHFSVFEALAQSRVDVLYFYPSGIGVNRNILIFADKSESPMDKFLPGWRELPEIKRLQGGNVSSDDEFRVDKSLVQIFRTKMRDLGFTHYDEASPMFRNAKHVPTYHLLFFSHDKAGLKIWKGIKKIEPGGQRSLL